MMKRVAKRKVLLSNDPTLFFTTQSLGLCNQLYAVACSLAEGIESKVPVAFKGFFVDMTSANFVCMSRLLNVDATNQNLKEKGTKIVIKEGPFVKAAIFPQKQCHNDYQVFCLRSLVFSDEICHLAATLVPKEPYYCVHFRLDIDFVLFYRSGLSKYREWLMYTSRTQEAHARAIAESEVKLHCEWIREWVARYVATVVAKCVDATAPIVALTAIGKPVMLGQNDLVEWAFLEFERALAPRRVLRNTSFASPGREYSAAVEMNIACADRCLGFIASDSSTFSHTIKLRIADETKHLWTV
jgi:hypothetical protein